MFNKKLNFHFLVITCGLIFISCIKSTKPESLSTTNKTLYNVQLGSPPGTYRIKNDSSKIVLPLEFFGTNLMVNAQMNNKKIKMLIDNGVMWDEILFYGSSIVDSLDIKTQGEIKVVGAGDNRDKGTDSYTSPNNSITFGDVTFHNQPAIITPKDSEWAEYFPGVAGQVCGAFFKHFIVEFNFDQNKLILHKPSSFNNLNNYDSIKMTRDPSGSYSIPVKISQTEEKEFNYKLFIDLGGIDPIALVINKKDEIIKPNNNRVSLGFGASGEITGYRGHLNKIKIGKFQLDNVQSIFTDSDDQSDHTNTTIGLPLLMRFNLIFDYFNEVLYIKPNCHFAKPYEIN